MKKIFILSWLLTQSLLSFAQMWNGTDTLYGNEWIDFEKPHYKIKVANDGIYRLPQSLIANTDLANKPSTQWRLYAFGKEVPIYTSTNTVLGASDFIEFYGLKNRNQIDDYLFDDPNSENLNPRYSMFNDTAVFYLTWSAVGQGLRYVATENNLGNADTPLPYCWQTIDQVYSSSFVKRSLSKDITYSWFDGNGYNQGPTTNFSGTLSLPQLYANGPNAQATIRYAGALNDHVQQLFLNDLPFGEEQFDGWKVIQKDFEVTNSLLSSGIANFKLNGTASAIDRNYVSFIKMRYPRKFNFENASQAQFQLEASTDILYLQIEGFNSSGATPIIFDLDNNIRIECAVEANTLKVVLPPSALDRRLVLVHPGAGVNTVSETTAVQFTNFKQTAFNYTIISHPALYGTGGAENPVAAYATYRTSIEGGQYQVNIADIEQLYDQFAYGVRFHAIAIKNYLHFSKNQWPALDHAFIIGKALDHVNFRDSDQQSIYLNAPFFIPTYSTPGADIPFTLRNNKLSEPIVAIGRLAATTPQQISDYLDKVKEHDQTFRDASQDIISKSWMKRVLHNSGGNSGETALIRGYTSDMANLITNNRFGAEVSAFYKTSNDPIQLSSYEQILNLVNGGVSIWSIFGHSSFAAVDFDIGTPASYNNKGRYPLMIVMGCYSGICSSTQAGLGEQFILAKDKGAIAYIAAVNASFTDALSSYANQYYDLIGGEDYTKSIGIAFKHTIAKLSNTGSPNLIAVLHQNLLQGDPALKLHTRQGADFVPDGKSISFNPNPISLEEGKVRLKFEIANIGENIGGNLALKIEQRLPDNTVLVRAIDTIAAPANHTSFEYNLPLNGSKIGFNRFFITLDPANQVPEQPSIAAELNNEASDASGEKGIDVYLYSDDIQAIAPENYSIVTKPQVTLWASTLNTNAAPLRYLWEMDTLETFNSSAKQANQVIQRGGLLSWKPSIDLKDGKVYYWRIARDSLVNGVVVWRTRSFIYLPNGSLGWNQSHYGQYRDANFSNMYAVDSLRELQFADNVAFLDVTVANRDKNTYPGVQNSYYDSFRGDYGFNIRNVTDGVVISIADPNNGHFIYNTVQNFNTADPPGKGKIFWFRTEDSLQRIQLMDFLQTGIQPGYYVGLLAFSRPTNPEGYAPHLWANDSITYGKNIFQILEGQGAQKVRQLAQYTSNPNPYGLIYRHNDPFFITKDTIGADVNGAVQIRSNFLAKWTIGILETPVIGPVKKWESLQWKPQSFDDPSDEASISLIAVRDNQPDSLLFTLNSNFDTTLNSLSIDQFPYLKLQYISGDTLMRSVTVPEYLRILYQPLPEGALHPAEYSTFYKDTLSRGDIMKSAIAFVNISTTDMDSVLVKYKVDNQSGSGSDVLRKYKKLPAGDSLHLDYLRQTKDLNGSQRLTIDVNPNNAQPEQYHFNNVTIRDFYVGRDLRNPLLDVTFDGQHILDGDLISPKPIIVFTLKDDNKFLALTDTATFSFRLELPDGTLQNISSQSPQVQFFPADTSNLDKKNQARLEWSPDFIQDGTYRLLVNGRDASGNESSNLDWSATFQVLTKSSLSNVLNYPNPFSTSTCFVYTMSGSETPLNFRLQIMTVSGRVIREVTESEFGSLRAGTHQSNFCWDGRDQYGDQLANGVYLYRIMAKKADGTDFEFFENTTIDGFFKHGFGKMVLMR